MKRDISIVINSCTLEYLKECVGEIIKYTDFGVVNAEFIIAANGMPPEAREWLTALGPHFPLLWYPERIGICKTTNDAIKIANSPIVGRMDDDAILLPWGGDSKWLQWLIQPFEDPKVGAVAPIVQDYDNGIIRGYKSVVGFLFVTRKTIWDAVGGFDEVFEPGMGEDSDFSFKVQNLGYTLSLPYGIRNTSTDPNAFSGNYPLWHKSNVSCNHSIVDADGNQTTIRIRNTKILNERYGGYNKSINVQNQP